MGNGGSSSPPPVTFPRQDKNIPNPGQKYSQSRTFKKVSYLFQDTFLPSPGLIRTRRRGPLSTTTTLLCAISVNKRQSVSVESPLMKNSMSSGEHHAAQGKKATMRTNPRHLRSQLDLRKDQASRRQLSVETVRRLLNRGTARGGDWFPEAGEQAGREQESKKRNRSTLNKVASSLRFAAETNTLTWIPTRHHY